MTEIPWFFVSRCSRFRTPVSPSSRVYQFSRKNCANEGLRRDRLSRPTSPRGGSQSDSIVGQLEVIGGQVRIHLGRTLRVHRTSADVLCRERAALRGWPCEPVAE